MIYKLVIFCISINPLSKNQIFLKRGGGAKFLNEFYVFDFFIIFSYF